MSWKVEGSTLIVEHKCGHTVRLMYGGRFFAEDDGPRQAAEPKCWECQSRELVQASQDKKGTP